MLEGGHGLIPEPVQLLAKVPHALGVDAVQPSGAVGLVMHQAGELKDAQVLRDGGAADRQLLGKCPHGQRAPDQPLEDRPSRRISQRIETVDPPLGARGRGRSATTTGPRSVRLHLP